MAELLIFESYLLKFTISDIVCTNYSVLHILQIVSIVLIVARWQMSTKGSGEAYLWTLIDHTSATAGILMV